jgi:hypothetical protein
MKPFRPNKNPSSLLDLFESFGLWEQDSCTYPAERRRDVPHAVTWQRQTLRLHENAISQNHVVLALRCGSP